jgi:hypothetical protein
LVFLLHSYSLYPAFKDARMIANHPFGPARIPSDHHNLDRGGKSGYYIYTTMRGKFSPMGAPVRSTTPIFVDNYLNK